MPQWSDRPAPTPTPTLALTLAPASHADYPPYVHPSLAHVYDYPYPYPTPTPASRPTPAPAPIDTLHTDYLEPYIMRHLVRLSSGPLTRMSAGEREGSQGRTPFGGGGQRVVVVGHCIGCDAEHTAAEVEDMPGMSHRLARCRATGATVRRYFTARVALRPASGREGRPS